MRIRRHSLVLPLAAAAASAIAALLCPWSTVFSVIAEPRPQSRTENRRSRPPGFVKGIYAAPDFDVYNFAMPRGKTREMGFSGLLASQISGDATELGIPEEERDDWIKAKMEQREVARLHGHLRRLEEDGVFNLTGTHAYKYILFAATTVPWAEVHEVLELLAYEMREFQKNGDILADHEKWICRRLDMVAWKPLYHWEYPRTGREEARVQQRVQDLCEEMTKRHYPDNPIDIEKVGQAAVNVPILIITRAFTALHIRQKKVTDPTAFLVAEIRPLRANQETMGPILSNEMQRNSFRRAVKWLGSIRGLELDEAKVNRVLAATGASMRIATFALKDLQKFDDEGEVPEDPTGFVIGRIIQMQRRYKEEEEEAMSARITTATNDEGAAERAAKFKAASAPLSFGASEEAKEELAEIEAEAEFDESGADELDADEDLEDQQEERR